MKKAAYRKAHSKTLECLFAICGNMVADEIIGLRLRCVRHNKAGLL